ncbi:glucosamine inositolphosphorylceramide transferase family protein [Methylobacterium marchantiae]|uniref:Formyl transferase n=1 Tax=Methylobacterium marchantiae TaxID=600331 RepID=A0ABW3WW68_9HYPH|nr:hypothetical protein AIGOOFII_3790 [Methylobacterium marchantiae]
MRLRLRLDGRALRRWHICLLERITALPGLEVEVDRSPGPGGLPDKAALLFRLEALLKRLSLDGLSSPAPASTLAGYPESSAAASCILDLCGDASGGPKLPIWRLSFDGIAGEGALLASLLAGRSPVAALSTNGRIIASGRFGAEDRGTMLTAFEDGLIRSITLIVGALSGARPLLQQSASVSPDAPVLTVRTIGARTAKMAARLIIRRLYYLCYRAPHWRVGWRRLTGPDLVDLRTHPSSGWKDLPDDGRRFYADPFGIEHEGRTVLFVEDFPHATGKALISAVTFDMNGPIGTPVPVLEEPHHLSYPFVFEREGSFWMIPESCANDTVDLYRATAFPGGWVKEATLLRGVTASDSTLLERDGRWWMFATVRDQPADVGGGPILGSYHDSLHLWSASDFRGPWTPHAGNPVLIDIASARPAGRIVERDGVLIRPVQDCRLGYGEALALARIDRLDDEGYAQTVETILRSGPLFPGTRLHTLNRASAFEFIDGSARSPRWRRRR